MKDDLKFETWTVMALTERKGRTQPAYRVPCLKLSKTWMVSQPFVILLSFPLWKKEGKKLYIITGISSLPVGISLHFHTITHPCIFFYPWELNQVRNNTFPWALLTLLPVLSLSSPNLCSPITVCSVLCQSASSFLIVFSLYPQLKQQ